MAITIKNRYLIIGIIAFVITTFFFGWGFGRKNRDNASQPLVDSLNSQIEYLSLKLRDKTVFVARAEQEILTLKDAINKGLVEKETLKALNLKNVSEITRLKGQIRILSDSIANTGNVIIVRDCDTTTVDTKKAIELPFTFARVDKYYQLHGGFDEEANMYVDLTVPFEFDLITGWDKKAKQYKANVVSPNPYVQFNGVRSIKVGSVKPKPWGIGFNVGYGVVLKSNPELRPYLGVGLSRDIIRW